MLSFFMFSPRQRCQASLPNVICIDYVKDGGFICYSHRYAFRKLVLTFLPKRKL